MPALISLCFIYYAGDILKKRITPFYAIELGYAFRPNIYSSYSAEKAIGGPMGAIGIGARIGNRSRKNIALSLNLDVKAPTNHFTSNYTGQTTTSSESLIMLLPSFKLGIGF